MTAKSPTAARKLLLATEFVVVAVIASILGIAVILEDGLDSRFTRSVERHLGAVQTMNAVKSEAATLQLYYVSAGAPAPDPREADIFASFDPASSVGLMEQLVEDHEAVHLRIGDDPLTPRVEAIRDRFNVIVDMIEAELPRSDDPRDQLAWRLANYDLRTSIDQISRLHALSFIDESGTITDQRRLLLVVIASSLLMSAIISGLVIWRLGAILRASVTEQEESEARLLSILRAIPDPVLFVDSDGIPRHMNDAFEDSFDGPQTAALVFDDTAGGGQDSRAAEITLSRADGSSLPARVVTGPVHGTDGSVIGRVAIMTDLSEARMRQQLLHQALAEARDANEAKTRFVANTSHELRTPLTSVLGFADVLLESPHLGQHEIECVEHIKHNGAHLLSLLDDILELSRIESSEATLSYSEVDVHQLIADLVTKLQPLTAARPVKLLAEVPERAEPVWTDPAALRQILMNLVSNGLKFTEEGTVLVRLVTDGQGAPERVEVSDTGIGIEPHMFDTVMLPFRQADDSRSRPFGGVGLGLAITAGLADALGYDLELQSEVGTGTTFSLVMRAVVSSNTAEELGAVGSRQWDPGELSVNRS